MEFGQLNKALILGLPPVTRKRNAWKLVMSDKGGNYQEHLK